MICPSCKHLPDTPGICNCECHPEDSYAGEFKKASRGMTALEFVEFSLALYGGTKQ